MTAHKATPTICICSTILASAAIIASAGSLNPPGGAVAPTMKTLEQVEPRTPIESLPGDGLATHIISQPGSYYLTGNLTGESGKEGIRVEADNVSIDLGGFTLAGVGGSRSGVLLVESTDRCTIHNGFIHSWGASGIQVDESLIGSEAVHTHVRNVQSSGNGGFGILLDDFAHVSDSTCANNAAHGILVGQESLIIGCTVNNNTGDGIFASNRSSVLDCNAVDNGGSGISILRGFVHRCLAAFNAGADINAPSAPTTLIDNHTD